MAVVNAASKTSAATLPHHTDDAGSSNAAIVSSATGTIQASSGAVARGRPMSVIARSVPRRSINLASAATAKTAASNNLTASKIIVIIIAATHQRFAAPCDFTMPRQCAKADACLKRRCDARHLNADSTLPYGRRFITIAPSLIVYL